MKLWLWGLVGALLLLWLFFPLQCSRTIPQPSVRAPEAPPLSTKQDPRPALVDRMLQKNRVRIAACLHQGQVAGAAIDLHLKWAPNGILESVRSVPDLGQRGRECLTVLIRTWAIPTATDLRPLSVSKRLSLEAASVPAR